MSNALIPLSADQQVSIHDDDGAFLALASANNFLPRLQLFGASSEVVKAGKFPMAHWGLVMSKDNIVDLGTEVNHITIARRFKAMDMSGPEILNFHNPKSQEFMDIAAKSGVKDSGCMAGNEFLIWIPDQKCFATFYAANTSAKQEASKIWALQGQAATFKVKFVPATAKNKNSWHAPVVFGCSDEISNLPSADTVNKTLENFRNPKDSDVVKITATPGGTADASRAQ